MAGQVDRPDSRSLVVIEPPRGWARLGLGELWQHRDLLYFLAWRDIKVRYKQSALGVAWAVLQPLMMMVIFTVFFGRLADVPSDGVPYPVFAFVRAGAVDVLRQRRDQRHREPRRQREPGLQGLLPAAAGAARRARCPGSPTSPSRRCCWSA